MSQAAPAESLALLPRPRELERSPGACAVDLVTPVELATEERRVERAVLDWRSAFPAPGRTAPAPGRGRIRIAVDRARNRHRDGYRLTVKEDGIEVLGGSPAGCFWGVQTLRQLSRFDAGEVPCVAVVDWPDFDTRGLLHDVTRGKVPTLDTLKHLADRLAGLKVNQLQLNIEHAFVFSFDPDVCRPDEGLTPDEVRELDAYCRERFVVLVPALATFGHMGRILSMPKYRHLAEVEATKTWDRMTWPERARGLTLDCTAPEALRLVERMWADALDAFSAPVVNICGDEPWELGLGKNRARCGLEGKGELYVGHLRRTHDLCASRGRTTQLWSDVIRNHRQVLDRLPRGSTVLHWGYDDQADYDGTALFTGSGFDTFVCPGTSGWKRVINALDAAEANIAAFAAAGLRHGASGLLNTDWGDHGHFNLLACSWHGIALGTALAWDAHHPIGGAFDERFARVVLGIDGAEGVSLLRAASRISERCETWRLLWMPPGTVISDPTIPTPEQLAESGRAAGEARRWLERFRPSSLQDPRDWNELATACVFHELFTEKMGLVHQARAAPGLHQATLGMREEWARRLAAAGRRYADCWQARNKAAGLADILAALRAAGDDLVAGRHE